MKNFKLFLLAALMAVLPVLGLAQSATQSTTLTVAMVAPSGNQPSGLTDTVYVTSTTGMLAQTSLGTFQTWLYIDGEASPVVAVPSTTAAQVLRGNGYGNLGTSPGAHVTNSTVLFGPYNNFVGADPSGSCVSTNYAYLPLIATSTRHLIACDTIATGVQVFARTGSLPYFVSAASCGILVTTTSVTDSGMVTLAAGNVVRKLVTTTTAGTTELTCAVNPPSELVTTNKGIIVTSVSLLYGVQGTGGLFSTTTAPILDSITYAAPGAAAKGTVATTACGTLTQTPVALVTAVTTSGVYNTVNEACGAPFYATNVPASLVFDFTLGNTTTALTYQIPGLYVYYDLQL